MGTSLACRAVNPLPLRERVAEGRVRGALAGNCPLTPAPSPAVGRGENSPTLYTYGSRDPLHKVGVSFQSG